MQMLMHLRRMEKDLNFTDITKLMGTMMQQCELSENLATKYARDNKIERQLIKAGLPTQDNSHLELAMGASTVWENTMYSFVGLKP